MPVAFKTYFYVGEEVEEDTTSLQDWMDLLEYRAERSYDFIIIKPPEVQLETMYRIRMAKFVSYSAILTGLSSVAAELSSFNGGAKALALASLGMCFAYEGCCLLSALHNYKVYWTPLSNSRPPAILQHEWRSSLVIERNTDVKRKIFQVAVAFFATFLSF